MIDLQKYNRAVPRYTSYPTVPFWDNESFNVEGYTQTLRTAFWESSKEVSIYIHLPFCEALCTYCACNTRITKNHAVEAPYVDRLLKEWKMYLNRMPEKPIIREMHLGGGTPTFFSVEQLERLISGILDSSLVSEKLEMSFEGHPGNTTKEHLQSLYNLGFRRVSFGIQDFDEKVQELINRKQSREQVAYVTNTAREIGYTSVNFDMVHGLPGQSMESLAESMRIVGDLKPDRIAYYSYAHVPSVRPAQRSFEAYLPSVEEKQSFIQFGKQALVEMGYHEIGMDHYILPNDDLKVAQENGRLHRNFMGYTTFMSHLMIGLGVSAIGDSWAGFGQNIKKLEPYNACIDEGKLPIERGHLHTAEDLFFRKHLLKLMCSFETEWNEDELLKYGIDINYDLLEELAEDGLIELTETGIKVHEAGRDLVRVIASAFDVRLNRSKKEAVFSKAI